MKTVIPVVCGAALFWTSSIAAQETECPPYPPLSEGSGEVSVGAEASLVTKVLSRLGANLGVKVAINEVLSRYSNSAELLIQLQRTASVCRAIMNNPALSPQEKQDALERLYKEVLREGDPVQRPEVAVPSAPPDSTSPYPSGVTSTDAVAMAEDMVLRMHSSQSTGFHLLAGAMLPFCANGHLHQTRSSLERALEQGLASVDKDFGQPSTAYAGTVAAFLRDPGPPSAVLTKLYDEIQGCQRAGVISPSDYLSLVQISAQDLRFGYAYLVVVDQQSGLVKSVSSL